MSRDTHATYNLLAVSAAMRETALNQPAILDRAMLVDSGDLLQIAPRIEDNAEEAHGHEEPTTLYNLGGMLDAAVNFGKMQPQHLAFVAAFALGSVSTAAAGGGYLHTITPIAGDLDAARSQPTFSVAQRLGNSVRKALFAGVSVGAFALSMAKDSWITLQAQLKGTGWFEDNVERDDVSGTGAATSVTLTRAVEGANAAARLDSIHRVQWRKTGETYWREVVCTAASAATPSVLTVVAPTGVADAGTFRVTYVPDEDTAVDTGSATSDPPNDTTGVLTDSAGTMTPDALIGKWLVMTSGNADGRYFKITDNDGTTFTCAGVNLYAQGVRSGDTYDVVNYGWLPLPALLAESPLRVSQMQVVLGGQWNGSAFVGGKTLASELTSVEYKFDNQLTPEVTPGAGQSKVANRARREGRTQSVTLNREAVDAILMHLAGLDDPEYLGLRLVATGAEYEAGYAFEAEVILPRVSLKNLSLTRDGRRLGESAELAVLEDSAYGSVIVNVRNQVAAYAA